MQNGKREHQSYLDLSADTPIVAEENMSAPAEQQKQIDSVEFAFCIVNR